MAEIRAFIAVELPEDVREALVRLQESLKASAFSCVRWVDPYGIHLTLKFLGNVAVERVPGIVEALTSAVEGVAPFRLELSEPGGFPGLAQPRVIWVALKGELEPLSKIQGRIESYLAQQGFPREERPFKAHLTLGRVREGASPLERRRLGEAVARARPESLAFPVGGVSLMKSTLTPSGAIYNRVALIELKYTILPRAVG